MEFQYHGANCISINTKNARIVIDDNLAELGLKSVTKLDDIALFTQIPNKLPSAKLVFADPGEYEASEISIFGVALRSHTDEEGQQNATIYKIQYGDTRVAIVGHIHPDVSDEQMEELGAIDVLFVPVGGNGYTLDPVGALSVIKKIEPKIVIPTHYEDSSRGQQIKYPVPQQPLSEALKTFSMEPKESVTKLKLKPADFAENMQLVILERA